MMAGKKTTGKPALELLEEAVHLLRMSPLHLLAIYYLGAVPFVLAFLFFWADMSRSAFAENHRAEAAIALAALFCWMKTWQAVFASQLRSQLSGNTGESWSLRRIVQTGLIQAIVQPIGFFILPVALLITLPFGYTFAFFQNVTILGDGRTSEIKPVLKKSAQLCNLWPSQNHAVLLVLLLFGFFVWLNIMTAVSTVPALIKIFLGIETVFTRSGLHAITNTTFIAAACGITYLCIDPLIKAVYALRCFYGESVTTGEDLRVELKAGATAGKTVFAAIVVLLVFAFSKVDASETGQLNDRSSFPTGIAVAELDDAIDEVLKKREFTWRLPREKTELAPEEQSWLGAFVQGVQNTIVSWAKSVRNLLRDIIEWFEKHFKKKTPSSSTQRGGGDGWMTTLQGLILILLLLIASTVVILFFRMWKRRREIDVITAQPVVPEIDLSDENVAANQLPEDGWLKLARELIEKGELRLALRAFYLAGLAHLANREFVSIAKFKSNREYEVELRRRAPALKDLQNAFAENVSLFDRVWYGMHEVSNDRLRDFEMNLERIRSC